MPAVIDSTYLKNNVVGSTLSEATTEQPFLIVDADGKIIATIAEDGSYYVEALRIRGAKVLPLENDYYAYAITDKDGYAALGIRHDGVVEVGGAAIGGGAALSAVDTAEGLLAVEKVGEYYQIFLYTDSAESQLTTLDADNYAPSLTQETPARILFTSNRSGTPAYHVMDLDGSNLAFAIPPKTIVQWGDSLTASSVGIGATRLANALGDGRTVINRGVGGQTATTISGRIGALAVTCSVTGEEIPATGPVGITSLSIAIVDAQGPTLLVYIAGVPGTLNYNGGSIIFTRTDDGDAVTAAGTQTVTPDLRYTIDNVVYSLHELLPVYWIGRNGNGPGGSLDTQQALCIAELVSLHKRCLVLPVWNGGWETESSGDAGIPTTSTTGYDTLTGKNNTSASTFAPYYYDIRADFIANAKTWMQTNYPTEYASDWGLAFTDVGDLRTDPNLGPDSDWDVAHDVTPRALRRDRTHANDMGNELLAELLAAEIHRRGW